jgi:hypothetical protein
MYTNRGMRLNIQSYECEMMFNCSARRYALLLVHEWYKNKAYGYIFINITGKTAPLSDRLPWKILISASTFTSSNLQKQFFYSTRSSALRPTPNLEDQVSVFISHSDRVAQR